jgi:hypothetical protein
MRLAVQSVFNSHLNEALNTKEHKKATDCTQLLFPGGGPCVLTDPMPVFIQKVSDNNNNNNNSHHHDLLSCCLAVALMFQP